MESSHGRRLSDLSIAANTTHIPRMGLYSSDHAFGLDCHNRFWPGWTFVLSSKLMIDPLPATFNITQPFLPFQLGSLSNWPVASHDNEGIHIFPDGMHPET
jgi:hypothetical protein